MGFTKRKKQPDGFRSNPYPTTEQILTGIAVDVGARVMTKALQRAGRLLNGEHEQQPDIRPPAPKKKAKKKAKAKARA